MRIVLRAKTATRCSTCSYLNPLPGLRHQAECVNCAEPIDVAGKIRDSHDGGLSYWFGGYVDTVAEALLYGEGEHELEDMSEGGGSALELRKVERFACHCGAALDAPATDPATKEIRCGSCKDLTPVRWPDAQTREWDPRITFIVGDAGDRGVALKQKVEGTVVKCGNCGAPLAQQGRQRALVCTHCHAENFLSDQIWTKLFPRPEQHVFYLVYDLREEDDAYAEAFAFLSATTHYDFKKAQQKLIRTKAHEMKPRILAAKVKRVLTNTKDHADLTEDVARAIVARDDLDKATMARIEERLTHAVRNKIVSHEMSAPFLHRWLHSQDEDVRAIAARIAKGDALAKCAADKSVEVRLAVAGRKDAPPEMIAALRKDPNERVRDKARENPAYKPGFFEKLFE
jgi:hypothetical protein